MQFELFEKLTSTNLFSIEQEKLYDYFLIIYKHEKIHMEEVPEDLA